MEIWKDIKGYEGRYQVSNLGRVKSLSSNRILKNGKPSNKKEKILKGNRNSVGYFTVNLRSLNISKTILIHRLVTETFIPNPDNKPQVNHINGIKTDNRVDNLEWCTHSENMQHAYDIGLNKGKR